MMQRYWVGNDGGVGHASPDPDGEWVSARVAMAEINRLNGLLQEQAEVVGSFRKIVAELQGFKDRLKECRVNAQLGKTVRWEDVEK